MSLPFGGRELKILHRTGFMAYCIFVLGFCLYMIYRVAPTQGSTNPLVYISICSLAGSISVMAIKGFGVALRLTFEGNNQLWRPGTWVFATVVVICIVVQVSSSSIRRSSLCGLLTTPPYLQMNYFNKVRIDSGALLIRSSFR